MLLVFEKIFCLSVLSLERNFLNVISEKPLKNALSEHTNFLGVYNTVYFRQFQSRDWLPGPPIPPENAVCNVSAGA